MDSQKLIQKTCASLSIAKEGKISKTLSTYKKAQKLDPYLELKGKSWNLLCWFGSIYRHADEVLFACEQAVELAPDEASKASYLGSRGLAKALIGNTQGAIADFQVLIDNPDILERYKAQRR